MISWMQKHNKYLVWTIWVATIAFIGAGFVGWGSYNFGSKAGNVAKVGDIEIKQTKLNMVYSNLYNQYNQAMQGTLDDKQAQEMGLIKQAFARLATQAKILNFAKDLGIIVSDAEVAQKLQEIRAFQKDGVFVKEIYEGYLKSQRLRANAFEETLREELILEKTFSLLAVETLPLEEEAISAAMNVSDKLAYKVLTNDDLNFVIDEAKVKAYWEMQKENFLTPQMYELSIVWTQSKDTPVTDDEIKAHYNANSFNYTDETGKQLPFEEAKVLVTKDLKIKKTKKTAQKAYIAFKKGNLDSSEKITLPLGDDMLTEEVWSALKEKSVGDILKPKVVADAYATVKIENLVLPKVKTYEEAKKEVTLLYENQAKKEALLALAESTLDTFDQNDAIISDFVKLEENVNLNPLNTQESLQFLQKLFTSSKEKGIISVFDKVIVYNILEQKLVPMDVNQTAFVKETANKLKQSTFESNLIKMLDKQYPTEVYMGGLTN
ncbi:peptidylprolyl isomerase [Sulfurovum sp. XGS-02]|uniref:peptidylprolyl isomerase n=1 Tax=Sulfurovum sp. XGS-02 TaxID=2925411 RepID=UPI00206520FA|nr:peptidylprolyl isomerase [Sulfurovum sp. XGS-02]UPT78095.1 peptidylprolyl isomerase [Sulfurovum sp. XGS-02]